MAREQVSDESGRATTSYALARYTVPPTQAHRCTALTYLLW
jgi:hypothetical protein